jgi:MDMPI C-terminal domain
MQKYDTPAPVTAVLDIPAGRVRLIAADRADTTVEVLPADPATAGTSAALDAGTMHVHATDDGLGGDGEWMVRREDSQVLVEHGHGKGDVAVRGPAGSLLLALVRRVPPDDPQVQVLGDRALPDRWLAATPF